MGEGQNPDEPGARPGGEHENPLSWRQRFSRLLSDAHPGNLDTKLPQLLDLTQEVLDGQVDTLFNRIPQWLIPEQIANRAELNVNAHEFIAKSRRAIEDNAIFKTLSETPSKARSAAREVVNWVNNHHVVQQAVNRARGHIQIADGITCVIEGTAGLTTTNQELDSRQSLLTLTYGGLELFEELPERIPRTQISIPPELKRRSLQIRRMIHHQLPHRTVVRPPTLIQTQPRPETPPQPGPAPAAVPA